MDFIGWDFLHRFHFMVVMKVRVTSIKRSQIAWDAILWVWVIIFDTLTHGLLNLAWRINTSVLIFHNELLLSEDLVGWEKNCVL